MFSALVQLLLLFVVFVVIPLVVWAARKRLREQHLRANPPSQAVMELVVPVEVTDTNKRMMDIWANLRNIFDPSETERAEGLGKVTFMFDVRNNGSKAPVLRCFLYCDKDKEAAVERALYSGFATGDLSIKLVKPKDDPRKAYMKEIKAMRETQELDTHE